METLADVLDREEVMEDDSTSPVHKKQKQEESDDDDPMPEHESLSGMCVECRDQPAMLHCEQCLDDYCDVCFQALHRRGTRKKHTTTKVVSTISTPQTTFELEQELQQETPQSPPPALPPSTLHDDNENSISDDDDDEEEEEEMEQYPSKRLHLAAISGSIADRAKFIPLRLTYEERKELRLLEAAMKVSEYTDKVDIISYKSKTARIHAQVKDICAILSGLVVASDYNAGQKLIKDKNFQDNEEFFQHIFEVGRRHKIMNPEKMRGEYGKLMYMLMDTNMSEVQDLLQFQCTKKVEMVYDFLEQKNGVKLLSDPTIELATMEIIPDGKSRDTIQSEIKKKEKAIEYIAHKYQTYSLSADEIKRCLYSIGDNNAFLRSSRDGCDQMIQYLNQFFSPDKIEEGYSLAIQAGHKGHRLTHSHRAQFYYVLQSLMLWRDVSNDMFKLWYFAEQDMLNTEQCPYRLRDTGQGLNRVQQAPLLYKAMHHIVHRMQQRVGDAWVGSSVIHLGDSNVPNALNFIDKYTQVPRILNPILIALKQIDQIVKTDSIAKYIQTTFGGTEKLKKDILLDFFQSAFDGSGADNFFDAGSCIDGRLTSCWNWCAQIEKKKYFPVFLLGGFVGFDGSFQ